MASYIRVGKYIVKKKIGEGAFAEVRLAVHEETKEEYAVKVFNRSLLPRTQFERDIKKEIRIMQHLRHPNIVSIHAVLVTASKMYLVMELVRGGELYDQIVTHGRIQEQVARRYFQQLVDAMAYCHKRGVVHRDLKPENILLDDYGNVKITDFGMSWIKSASNDPNTVLLSTQCGTPKYMAPEVIMRPAAGYDGQKLDVWECGMVLFALLAGYLPFAGDDDNAVFRSILNGRIRFPYFFSDGAKDLLSTVLVKDPEKRASMEDIRHHPWFQIDYEGDQSPDTPAELTTPPSPWKARRSPSSASSNVSSPSAKTTAEFPRVENQSSPLRDVTNELQPQTKSDSQQQTCSPLPQNRELPNDSPKNSLNAIIPITDDEESSTSSLNHSLAYQNSLENILLASNQLSDSTSPHGNARKPAALPQSNHLAQILPLDIHTSEDHQNTSIPPSWNVSPPSRKTSAAKPKKLRDITNCRATSQHNTPKRPTPVLTVPKRRSTRKAMKLPHVMSPGTQWRTAMDKKLEEMDDEPDDPELTETIIAGTPSPRPALQLDATRFASLSSSTSTSNQKNSRKAVVSNSGNDDEIASPHSFKSCLHSPLRLPKQLKPLSHMASLRSSGRLKMVEEDSEAEQQIFPISPINSNSNESPVKAILRNIRSIGSAFRAEPDSPDDVNSASWFDSVGSPTNVASTGDADIRKKASIGCHSSIDASGASDAPHISEPTSSTWKYLYRTAFSRGK